MAVLVRLIVDYGVLCCLAKSYFGTKVLQQIHQFADRAFPRMIKVNYLFTLVLSLGQCSSTLASTNRGIEIDRFSNEGWQVARVPHEAKMQRSATAEQIASGSFRPVHLEVLPGQNREDEVYGIRIHRWWQKGIILQTLPFLTQSPWRACLSDLALVQCQMPHV